MNWAVVSTRSKATAALCLSLLFLVLFSSYFTWSKLLTVEWDFFGALGAFVAAYTALRIASGDAARRAGDDLRAAKSAAVLVIAELGVVGVAVAHARSALLTAASKVEKFEGIENTERDIELFDVPLTRQVVAQIARFPERLSMESAIALAKIGQMKALAGYLQKKLGRHWDNDEYTTSTIDAYRLTLIDFQARLNHVVRHLLAFADAGEMRYRESWALTAAELAEWMKTPGNTAEYAAL